MQLKESDMTEQLNWTELLKINNVHVLIPFLKELFTDI